MVSNIQNFAFNDVNFYITQPERRHMKLDILAIGAHPDDIELACGGTVIKLGKQGKRVGIVDLTAGELGTRGTPETRAREAAEAARILGATVRENLGIDDGNIENNFENRRKLIEVIRKYTPDVLLIPFSVDRHPDHEHAHLLCRESWFYAGLERIDTRADGVSQRPFRPRAYYQYMQWYDFIPSFIVDISSEYEERMNAVRAFRSQFYDPENTEPSTILSTPEFMELVRTRLQFYGDKIGRAHGEAFFSVAPPCVNDIWSLNT
jgi:bacillithiol biosynthesis deacetylase BshB1